MPPTRPLAHNPRAMCEQLRSKRKHRLRGKEQKFIYDCQRIGQLDELLDANGNHTSVRT